MGNVRAPANLKRVLESTCKVAAQDLSKLAPGEKNKKRLAEKLTTGVCKDVDQKILKLVQASWQNSQKAKMQKFHPALDLQKSKASLLLKSRGMGYRRFRFLYTTSMLAQEIKPSLNSWCG